MKSNKRIMKQIHVSLELGADGYGVSFRELDAVFGFGETVESAKADACQVVEDYIKVLATAGKPVPEILQGDYELIFEFDIEALLRAMRGKITKRALSKASGIHPTQLSHYGSGLKRPRKKQQDKIIAGLHQLGKDLL
jgi:predicted RNase H-like HicB family nuclease